MLVGGVADDSLVDVQDNRRRFIRDVLLPGQGGPVRVGQQALQVTTCQSVNLCRDRLVFRRILGPEHANVGVNRRRLRRHISM